MKKLTSLMLIFVLTITLFAGCSNNESDDTNNNDQNDQGSSTVEDTSWKDIVAKGKIIVGLDDTFAPMGFRDEDDNLVGFDIDLANAVGDYLGIEIEFRPIDWKTNITELDGKRVDCLWNGMSATPARQESMCLTNKYMNNQIILMTTKEDITVTSTADLVGKQIGVQAGSAALEAMEAHEDYDTFKANVLEYDTYDEAILNMQAGRLDVIVIDEIFGNYKDKVLGHILKTMDFVFGPDYYAIGCRKADIALKDKLNEAIQALINNGVAEQISNKWFDRNLVIFEDYQ